MSEHQNKSTLISIEALNEIKNLFNEIDHSIISLLKCSKDDFQQLNDHFKKCNKDAKIIAENANQVLSKLTTTRNSFDFINEITNNNLQVSNFKLSFIQSINNLDKFLDTIYRSLEMMFVPTNNFNQNVMTLKLLVAKVHLEKQHTSSPINPKEITNKIDEIKLSLNVFNSNLDAVKEKILSSNNDLGVLLEDHEIELESFIKKLNSSQILLSEKYKEAGRITPDLQRETKQFGEDAAKIITNLQYDDILRQKIEHVQEIHHELSNELIEFDNKTSDQNKLVCFIKIRNIATLQASQLIHANKEYQTAIENISNRLMDFVDTMSNVTNLCDSFASHSNETKATHFINILTRLNTGENIQDKLLTTQSALEIINNVIGEDYANSKSEFTIIDKKVSQILEKLLPSITHNSSQNSRQKLNQYIEPLLSDIANNRNKVNDLFYTIEKAIGDFNNEVRVIQQKIDILTPIFKKNHNIILTLEKENSLLAELLASNRVLSKTVFKEVKESVEQVKYYGYFEKTIENIIKNFESINNKLHELNDLDMENETLKNLKEHYTMKSEHKVHEYVLGNTQSTGVDLFEEETDDEDDNLELF